MKEIGLHIYDKRRQPKKEQFVEILCALLLSQNTDGIHGFRASDTPIFGFVSREL